MFLAATEKHKSKEKLMAEKLIGSAIFGQSGGPTSVINSSAYGVIRTALDSDEITNVYGAENGIIGVLNDRLFDMSKEDADELLLLVNTPSSELGSCRYKIADPDEAERLRDWIFNTEYGDFCLPVPDLNIFLDVPIGFVESKLRSQRGGTDREYLEGGQDIHEADIEFQKRVRAIYKRQCELDPKFIRIDCSDEYGEMLPPGAIFAKIQEIIDIVIK
jgi:hypothetical protein